MSMRRSLNRRDFLRGAALAAAGMAGLAACAPATGPAAPAAEGGQAQPATEQITLTFIVDTINDGHIAVRDAWAQEFMETHPNVRIDHQTVPQEYTVKIQTLYAAGTPADIYRYLQEVTPIITVAEKNMHLVLDDYIARDNYDMDDFRPDAVRLYQWDGKTYALPRDYGNQNLFYNLDLFEAAGLELPPADWEDTSWTFEKFLETAQALTKKEGDRTTQWGFLVNRAQRPWASWLYCNNGALVHT
ncbi:MAG TPA: extracellular solute-binding protein, partial [Caldilineaceae bacterium]|nr:extracellular solute-binding protein [Caldilineaceae bacterium]